MKRFFSVVGINASFGAFLGGLTAAATVPFMAAIGPVIGVVIGLVTSPAVALAVRRKALALALPLIYSATVIVSLIAVSTQLPGYVIGLAILTIGFASACVWLLLPNAPFESRDGHVVCERCGYDLTGNVSGHCPECGAPHLLRDRKHPNNSVPTRVIVSLFIVVGIFGGIALRKTVSMRPAKDVDGLIRQLADGEALVHEPAINELVKRGKEPLLKALGHANPTVRSHAVKGLWRLADPTTVPDLVAALGDSDPWARMWAAGALGEFGNETAICPLLKLRNDRIAGGNVKRALESLRVPLDATPGDYGCEESLESSP